MPNNISQIFISDSSLPMSDYLTSCVTQIKLAYPTHEHIIYDKNSLREFIEKKFDRSVLAAYDKLRPYAYKADLGRYCLLYEKGGWYFDISIRLINPIVLDPHIRTLAFRDLQYASGTSFSCSNTILFAKKKDPVFEQVITGVVKNCDEEYYGISTLCPTGANVLGAAFAIHGAKFDRIFGEVMLLTPYHQYKNTAFIMPNGTIFALNKPTVGGGLEMLGASGTNDYNKFYYEKRVYESSKNK